MDVFIIRHGKAEDQGPEMSDADRRLTKKGREEIAAAGRWMASQGLRFDLIASSPLVRAQETAAIVAGALGISDCSVTWKVLAPGGNPDTVCHVIGKHPDHHAILIVGHEPMLSTLISRIIGGGDDTAVVMGKGSLAKIRNYRYQMSPSGELQWLLTVKLMAEKG